MGPPGGLAEEPERAGRCDMGEIYSGRACDAIRIAKVPPNGAGDASPAGVRGALHPVSGPSVGSRLVARLCLGLAVPATTGGHPLATVRATLAGSDAIVHVTESPAALGAVAADPRAKAAMLMRIAGSVEHQRRSAAAGLDAVEHQAEVRWFNMLAAQFEAVQRSGLLADAVAVQTVLDALGEFFGHLLMHGDSPGVRRKAARGNKGSTKGLGALRCNHGC